MKRNISMNSLLLVCLYICLANSRNLPTVDINLDLAPQDRYTQIAQDKANSITQFIDSIKSNSIYAISYTVASFLFAVLPQRWIMSRLGQQFYLQCLSYARGIGRPLSELVTFNFMYQLGAYHDFCTSIPVSNNNNRILGRNLDYGFQQLLKDNSLHFRYFRQNNLIVEQLGHAGLVGLHTGLNKNIKFSVSLNERVQGGLHQTIIDIFTSNCIPCPTLLANTVKSDKTSIKQIIKELSSGNTCAAVYYIINTADGQNIIINKNRGIGVDNIIYNSISTQHPQQFLVQTNTDSGLPDPDGRQIAAFTKLNSFTRDIEQEDLWNILINPPNYNNLTLITAILDSQKGTIRAQVWSPQQLQQILVSKLH